MHQFMLVYEYILNVPEETKVGGAACVPVILDHWQLYYAHVEDNPNKGSHFPDSCRFPCGQKTSTRKRYLGDFVGCIPVCLTNQEFPQLMGEEEEEVVHWLCCFVQGCSRAMSTITFFIISSLFASKTMLELYFHTNNFSPAIRLLCLLWL